MRYNSIMASNLSKCNLYKFARDNPFLIRYLDEERRHLRGLLRRKTDAELRKIIDDGFLCAGALFYFACFPWMNSSGNAEQHRLLKRLSELSKKWEAVRRRWEAVRKQNRVLPKAGREETWYDLRFHAARTLMELIGVDADTAAAVTKRVWNKPDTKEEIKHDQRESLSLHALAHVAFAPPALSCTPLPRRAP